MKKVALTIFRKNGRPFVASCFMQIRLKDFSQNILKQGLGKGKNCL